MHENHHTKLHIIRLLVLIIVIIVVLRNGKGLFFGWISIKFCFRDMDKNIISCLQYTTLTSYLRLIFNDLLELKPDKHHENREGSWYVQMYS